MAKASYQVELKENIREGLSKELNEKNIHALPHLEKVVVSIGIGSMMQKSKDFSNVANNLTVLTGQKCVVKKSKMAISNFKLRQGMPVGLMVTLRGKKMYAFVAKLIHVIFPRVRDFRGLSTQSFDGQGNYSIGLKEQTVFPEIRQDDDIMIHGVQITFSTSAKNAEEGKALLTQMGLPFQKK